MSANKRSRTQDPTSVATEADLEWSAGFLEGEGFFTWGQRTTKSVGANQRFTAEPLQRLLALFGGSLYWRPKENRWVWTACGV